MEPRDDGGEIVERAHPERPGKKVLCHVLHATPGGGNSLFVGALKQ
jgi:hypothetical protein